jgi:hypothetical protein
VSTVHSLKFFCYSSEAAGNAFCVFSPNCLTGC